ncbi:MAG: radical SAM protein, partial [Candidatus Heimdallarchaeota archaeon]
MKTFSLLIKPVSADCNLRCKYCFYIGHLDNIEPKPRMSENTLETMIASYMQTDQNNNYAFGWQGGEPTLLGIKFWEKVVELQTKYAPPGAVISNGLQTNGTLITDELARLFAEYRFLLGVSLDGPPHLHDIYRKTIGQTPSHSLVLQGIKRLKKANVEFNILTLVNSKTVKNTSEIYQYLKDNEFYYHQYIPCVEFDRNGNLEPYSITGDEWGDFLCELFETWIRNDINKVSIRLFDSIINYLINGTFNVCYMGNNCCQYFVVEYDGNVYPCDFFVQNDLLLGNVKTNSWDEIKKSPIYLKFCAK